MNTLAMGFDGLPGFDIEKLDEKIRGIVSIMRWHGFVTFTSCQGGEGHSFKLPTVGIMAKHSEKESVIKFLLSCEISDFSIVEKKSNNEIWKSHYAKDTDGEYLCVQGMGLLNLSPAKTHTGLGTANVVKT